MNDHQTRAEFHAERVIREVAEPIVDPSIAAAILEALHTEGLAVVRLKDLEIFMSHCGQAGTCRGCGARIYWFKDRLTQKPWPIGEHGAAHHIDCPKAAEFRRK